MIAVEMNEAKISGLQKVEVRDSKAKAETDAVTIKYRRIRVLSPIGKQKRYPVLYLKIFHATERDETEHRPKIDWKLITDLPVHSRNDAVDELGCYAMR